MTQRAWLLVPLAALLIAIAPLAEANPPDCNWFAGVYDDNDFDDVVGLVLLDSNGVQPATVAGGIPDPARGELSPAGAPAVSSCPRTPRSTRGPPAF
jgi:hypothetical protein